MRNWPVYVLLGIALLGVVLIVGGEPEPLRTARALAAAVCPPARGAFERDVLERHLAERVELSVADGDEGTYERAELLERIFELRVRFPSCSVDIARAVTVEEGPEPRVLGELELSEMGAPNVHADRREVAAVFRRVGDDYRLLRLRIGARRYEPPEARP